MIKIFKLRLWEKKDVDYLITSLNKDVELSVANEEILANSIEAIHEKLALLEAEIELLKIKKKLMKAPKVKK